MNSQRQGSGKRLIIITSGNILCVLGTEVGVWAPGDVGVVDARVKLPGPVNCIHTN